MKHFLLVLTLIGCANAHYPPCESGTCAEGFVCDPSIEGNVCVPACVIMVDGFICEDGAACYFRPRGGFRCAAGGTVEIGEVVLEPESCVFGTLPREDWTSDPLVWRCLVACSNDGDCAVAETCTEGGCVPRCAGRSEVCGPANRCAVDGGQEYCVNERRFARIDCDGDGSADCPPYATCDASAVGGCTHPAAEDL